MLGVSIRVPGGLRCAVYAARSQTGKLIAQVGRDFPPVIRGQLDRLRLTAEMVERCEEQGIQRVHGHGEGGGGTGERRRRGSRSATRPTSPWIASACVLPRPRAWRSAARRGKNLDKLETLPTLLIHQEPLPRHYRDHLLCGSLRGYREARLEPDWLVIYSIRGGELYLVRTGTAILILAPGRASSRGHRWQSPACNARSPFAPPRVATLGSQNENCWYREPFRPFRRADSDCGARGGSGPGPRFGLRSSGRPLAPGSRQ